MEASGGMLGFFDKNRNYFPVNSADEFHTEVYQGEFPFHFLYDNREPVWFRAVKNCTLSSTEPATQISTRAGEIGVNGAYISPINPKKRSVVAFSYYPKVTLVLQPTYDEDENPMYPLYLGITVEKGAEKVFPITVTGTISYENEVEYQDKNVDLTINWTTGEYKKVIAIDTEFPSDPDGAMRYDLHVGGGIYSDLALDEVPQYFYVTQN